MPQLKNGKSPDPTPEQLQLLAELFDNGATLLVMMQHPKIRRSYITVKRWLASINRVCDHSKRELFRVAGERERVLAQMVELRAKGYSCSLIAREVGVKPQLVQSWLQKEGIDTALISDLLPWQEEIIRRLHAEGECFENIMRAVGVGSCLLAKWLKELELPSPPPPSRNRPPAQPKAPKEKQPRKVPVRTRRMPVVIEPAAKRPANMMSIADRFKYQAPPSQSEYRGYKFIDLGRVRPERSLPLGEILSINIKDD